VRSRTARGHQFFGAAASNRDDAIAGGGEGARHHESEPAAAAGHDDVLHWSLSPCRKGAASVRAILSKWAAMNPATLSTPLARRCPPGAIAADLREPGDPLLLLPTEAAYVARAVPKRVQEFAAGRPWARRAAGGFGHQGFSLR